jgi:hypothetical protein
VILKRQRYLPQRSLIFFQEIYYEQKGQSETVRLNKNAKILGLAVHPITERNFSVLASDGRLIFIDVLLNDGFEATKSFRRINNSSKISRPLYCLEDHLPSRYFNYFI